MSNGSMLPQDIREQLESRSPPPAARRESPPPEPAKSEPEQEERDESAKTCPNPACFEDLQESWDYCAKCGADLVRHGAAKRLGVEFTDEDVQDYLFKGYVVRDIKVLGKHTVTIKSSQPKDLKEIDDYIMNGTWLKDKNGKERTVSDFLLRQMNAIAVTAAAIQKMDGKSIGETLVDRLTWLDERGSALVDILSQRVVLFNQALTAFLKKEDTYLGS